MGKCQSKLGAVEPEPAGHILTTVSPGEVELVASPIVEPAGVPPAVNEPVPEEEVAAAAAADAPPIDDEAVIALQEYRLPILAVFLAAILSIAVAAALATAATGAAALYYSTS